MDWDIWPVPFEKNTHVGKCDFKKIEKRLVREGQTHALLILFKSLATK